VNDSIQPKPTAVNQAWIILYAVVAESPELGRQLSQNYYD